MIYLEPFRGHKEIRAYFDKVTATVPSDLKFAIEDISDTDPRAVGVKWCAAVAASAAFAAGPCALRGPQQCRGCARRHVEVDGNEFPFSRGARWRCSVVLHSCKVLGWGTVV